MEILFDSWSLAVILLAAFVIGWAAETAQTFIPRALALSILAWLQTLPEFAVEAAIAWDQKRDLMIANLTGSLRLLVGLGWPMIFFVHFFFQWFREKRFVREIRLEDQDFIGVLFLFVSVLYFLIVLAKGSLTVWDAGVLTIIYGAYLWIAVKMPVDAEGEHEEDLPWIGQQIMRFKKPWPGIWVTALFVAGGAALYLSVHPFINTLQNWSLKLGISTFIFVQWVAPFLSEFPEKVSAFNWARQTNKAPMAVMNMVNSNINQWTMLAAMIPIVFSLSLGHVEAVHLDTFHAKELALTIAQSFLGGMLLLDMRFSLAEALLIFLLWVLQLIWGNLRDVVTILYVVWIGAAFVRVTITYINYRRLPRAIALLRQVLAKK